MNVIITGVTGMVGEGVLHECLHHPAVDDILLVGRRASGFQHPKVRELVQPDMFDFGNVADQLTGYDACFFCLGTTSVGKGEAEFTRTSYDLTLAFARVLVQASPGATFCYVSGAGTDSTETGRTMWARVKGRTENALLALGFRQAFMFRPGYLHPTPGLQNTSPYYRYVTWLYPAVRRLFPNTVSTLADLGRAMLNATLSGYPKAILEVKDINALAQQHPTTA